MPPNGCNKMETLYFFRQDKPNSSKMSQADRNALYDSYKERLKSLYELMLKSLEVDPVLDDLLSEKAITESQHKIIKERTSRREQVYSLLDMIQDGTYKTMKVFVKALRQDQNLLAISLTGI